MPVAIIVFLFFWRRWSHYCEDGAEEKEGKEECSAKQTNVNGLRIFNVHSFVENDREKGGKFLNLVYFPSIFFSVERKDKGGKKKRERKKTFQ